MTTCPACGSEDVVEVDNPMRVEVRHRRGVQCPGKPFELPADVVALLNNVRKLTPAEMAERRRQLFDQ